MPSAKPSDKTSKACFKLSFKSSANHSDITNVSSVKHLAKPFIELSPESFVKLLFSLLCLASATRSSKLSAKPSDKPSAVNFTTNAVLRPQILLRPKFLLGTRFPDAATFSTSVPQSRNMIKII
jgi:hypothetical protein